MIAYYVSGLAIMVIGVVVLLLSKRIKAGMGRVEDALVRLEHAKTTVYPRVQPRRRADAGAHDGPTTPYRQAAEPTDRGDVVDDLVAKRREFLTRQGYAARQVELACILYGWELRILMRTGPDSDITRHLESAIRLHRELAVAQVRMEREAQRRPTKEDETHGEHRTP